MFLILLFLYDFYFREDRIDSMEGIIWNFGHINVWLMVVQIYCCANVHANITTRRSSWSVAHKTSISQLLFEVVKVDYIQHHCRNPTFGRMGGWHSHPEMGTWESTGTPKTSEFDCRGQNTSHWSVLYIIGKLSKCKCRKWARTSHLDIYSTSYGKKRGRESIWL